MFKEKELYKHASFYCANNTKYSMNLFENKAYADTAVHRKRGFGPVISPKLQMRKTTNGEIKNLITSSNIPRMAQTSNTAKYCNTTIYNTFSQK